MTAAGTASSSFPSGSAPCSYGTSQMSTTMLGNRAAGSGKRGLVRWFHRLILPSFSDSRTKLRWGVLIRSDSNDAPAFLVLFKLHRRSARSSNYHLNANTRRPIGQKTDSRSRVNSYTPEMFSTRNCQVLVIGTALMDYQSAYSPSVLISDVMGVKHKLYRLLPAPNSGRELFSTGRPSGMRTAMLQHDQPREDLKTSSPLCATELPLWPHTIRVPRSNLRKTQVSWQSSCFIYGTPR
ncbi:unnamed protein product [Echinostoma caproni]|uniref:Secreted protein n=1 Tax=Echinostoma caproni TaxID=27848 RepID=A0A183B937_9TREM|nr:unnamed protein product [Echinostoma caproni]